MLNAEKCAKHWESMLKADKCWKIGKTLRKYVKVHQSMRKCAESWKKWENVLKAEKVC